MREYIWDSVTVVAGDEDRDEPLGTKAKFWVVNPEDDTWWLFKYSRITAGRQMGEDWAEWVAHHVADLLGVPCARIKPATCGGRRGIVSRNVVDREAGERLVHGNSLLEDSNRSYNNQAKRENPGYTLEAVQGALSGISAPSEWAHPGDGFDVWCGYLVLDAIIAGRDRHHENWAAIGARGEMRLAPSFDHGNALGFQEPTERAAQICASPASVERWARKGKSHHFAGKPTLVDLACDALVISGEANLKLWRDRVEGLSIDEVHGIVRSVPREIMSEASATFAETLIANNRRRLLDAIDFL